MLSEGANACPSGGQVWLDLPGSGSFAEFLRALRRLCSINVAL